MEFPAGNQASGRVPASVWNSRQDDETTDIGAPHEVFTVSSRRRRRLRDPGRRLRGHQGVRRTGCPAATSSRTARANPAWPIFITTATASRTAKRLRTWPIVLPSTTATHGSRRRRRHRDPARRLRGPYDVWRAERPTTTSSRTAGATPAWPIFNTTTTTCRTPQRPHT